MANWRRVNALAPAIFPAADVHVPAVDGFVPVAAGVHGLVGAVVAVLAVRVPAATAAPAAGAPFQVVAAVPIPAADVSPG